MTYTTKAIWYKRLIIRLIINKPYNHMIWVIKCYNIKPVPEIQFVNPSAIVLILKLWNSVPVMQTVSMVVPVLMNPTFAWAFMTRAIKTIAKKMKYVAIGRNNDGTNAWMVANPLTLVAKIFARIHSKLILLAVPVMKNAWTAVRVRAVMNAALSLPLPHLLLLPLPAPRAQLQPPHLPPPHLPPPHLPLQPLRQLQQAVLWPPQRNRFRLQQIQTVIFHYRTSTCWFSIPLTLKK